MNSTIDRVLIVDDDRRARDAYSLTVEDALLEPVQVDGPIRDLDQFVAETPMQNAGALCDFELSVKNFATFTGAQLVAQWYQARTPAVLCTRFEKAQLDRIRPFRAWIPRLLTPAELNPDSLVQALSDVMQEIEGVFRASRRAHRTMIRVVEIDPGDVRSFLFEMPGWSTDTMLRYRIADLPPRLQPMIVSGFRTHVYANIGAESFEDLYFSDWAVP